jgi:hypothetical protein
MLERAILNLILVASTACVASPDFDAAEPIDSVACTSCGGDCRTDTFTITSSAHTTDTIDYADIPPTGGAHHPCWATWGVHTEAVPDEHWVHNLEHGGVVLLYNCTDCQSEIDDAASWVNTTQGSMLLTPYPALPARWAAVAWGARTVMGCYDRAAFEAFFAEHFDHAPESLRAPPPCQ